MNKTTVMNVLAATLAVINGLNGFVPDEYIALGIAIINIIARQFR